MGWIRKLRKQKKWIFADVIDGSTMKHLQMVINTEKCENNLPSSGCAIEVTGKLVPSNHPLQKVELQAESMKVVGPCDVLRNHFVQIHTPVISSNDCENAGDAFTVQMPESDEQNVESAAKDFFGTPTYLSVSGQLHLEAVVSGLSRVYSFNPAFRAENGITRRHLSEFYMIEAELAFLENLNQLMNVMEDMVKSVFTDVLESCSEYLKIHQSESHYELLKKVLSTPFIRLTYSEAFDILLKHKDKLSKEPIKESGELNREQEILLVDIHNQVPVFVTDYPSHNKPFYMKACEENPNNVKSVDLLAPYVGELCGGSLRETSITLLEEALHKAGQSHQLKWYIDLRKYGDAPHAGFGAGFERLLLLITGLENIRDVMPFPRWAHNCKL
ncbi:putative asparagine--tRNA ligase, mitochondrial [Nymphon striatum]|nr:putative asparagine--tRNA ligase, mitochondrial [Nymphon striatum]